VFGHLAHVRLPRACDAGAFRRVLAACWPRVECLASPSLLPLMCQLQPVWSSLICRRPGGSSGFSGCRCGRQRRAFAHAVCPSRCQLVWYLVGCWLVDGDPVSNLFSTNLAPCRRRDSQSHLKGANLRTPQPKILTPRRLMSAATEFATILTASPSTLT